MSVRACPVPHAALLQRYVARGQAYTDCFEAQVPATIELSQFITAFYTTWLFRAERLVLRLAYGRRISDADVAALAEGAAHFAVWTVEARDGNEILLRDLGQHTRSYLAVKSHDAPGTLLIFGSAVVPSEGRPLGRVMRALIPLHRLYSRVLLGFAARALR